jgi:hypothetical protein
LIDIWANSEDNWQEKLEFLAGHGLEVHRIIVRLDAEALALEIVRFGYRSEVEVNNLLVGKAKPRHS